MSYILDALKKSEEERKKRQEEQESRYPRLSRWSAPPRRSRLVPALIMVSFMLTSIIIFGAGMWYTSREQDVEPVVAPMQKDTPAARQVRQLPISNEPPVSETVSAPPEEPVPAAETVEKAPPLPSPEPAVAAIPADQGVLPLMTELPFATRSMLPDLDFRGHVYSPAPEKRMIMINAVVVREGDLVAPGLTLTEITDNGLIMNFRETLFKIDLFHAE